MSLSHGCSVRCARSEDQPQPTAITKALPASVPIPADALPVNVSQPLSDVLRQINSVNAFQSPKLSLKLDDRYAHTEDEVAPYSGVEPFKRHFLLQMEYSGAGRSVPEPEHVDSVKIGFVGPIMSTVSVATGGKSHEEALGMAPPGTA